MDNSFSSSMYLPCTLFETVSRFDDRSADDMQCGDMGERELLALGLRDISAKVDPYRLVRYDLPNRYELDSPFSSSVSGVKISHQQCVEILFNEMKELSLMFSFEGKYKMLIGEMIDHFRFGNGCGFYSERLNLAFHERLNSYLNHNPMLLIENAIEYFYSNSTSRDYPELLHKIKYVLLGSTLPKFNENEDRINGLGITVHDIAAQTITLSSLQEYTMGWSATLFFEAQDHFGLDVIDIQDKLYSQFRFFRIWFFLQRHRDFAFKPFFTNFNSVEKLEK
ncbi:DUF3289 family protein [Lelliottia sp. V89_10]|uniref:YPO3983 family protein n=1 Tax=Lelliottia wanjuensis TaxID=3050585 RepID=UPI00249F87F5|nr:MULTISPECIES: YPO3983 family protein [unclassified Lelliottia]MDI3358979.1 DUF3289 family protein [Lelliottia sp. V89_13]MDK9548511.1 DUF3289 family protein [Lelliottia sp. V89_5]MDK9597790.1 DUF3289 family protein [Lelliottia sp. V89_10]